HKADVNAFGNARLWDRRIMNEPRPKDMNKGGFSPLLYAAREGCTACIPVLAKAGADLNGVDPDRTSALNVALMNLHFDTAMALIDAGADVNQWDIFGQAPLFNAIDMNTIPVGGRADLPSEDKTTALEVAKVLLEKGANPNMQLKVRPPYRNAVFDRGSDGPLSEGATPLLRAARAADNAAVQLLLDHGALVDLPNARGHTPLLAVAGIDWSAEPTRGRYKTEEASIETIRLLLEHGANINALTGDPARRPKPAVNNSEQKPANARGPVDHQNALHPVAKLGWTKIAQFLIDNGIEQQVVDTSGKTPFDLAMGRYQSNAPIQPNLEMAQLLQTNCAAVANCEITDPLTPEQMAKR
ncbi:MAG: ankyrin repeat domain-containing protein, partial [Azoarcus sp.]|nr:ankyrin repeat domain-containing protein [Azoarcus sp.]